MFSLNRATIIGYLTRDPELRTTPNGQSVANLGIATNRRWTDAAGQTQEASEFHDIVAWGKLAEIISTYLHKGDRAYLEGRLQTRSWEGQDGVKRYRTEIVAENLIMLSPRKDGASAPKTNAGEEDQSPKESAESPVGHSGGPAIMTSKKSLGGEKVKTPTEETEAVNIDDIPF